jgi:7-cyano-7-deazaguanine synthase
MTQKTSGTIENGRPRAIVLLSGGLDSATALAVALRDGFDPYAISFDYRQRHAVELQAARRVAAHFGVRRHEVVEIDLRAFGGSALTSDMPVPKDRSDEDLTRDIPVTYVPARNTIFLSFALAYAEVIGARDIFIGVNALDYSGYPDCRPEFVTRFEQLANVATKAGVEGNGFRVHAPLIALSKREIVELGTSLGVDYSLTSSCYDPTPEGEACGHCDSCQLRMRGFAEAGLTDPIRYVDAGAVTARA